MTNDASLPRGWMYHLYFGNSSPFLDSSKENQASLFTVAAPEGMPDPTEGTRHLTLLSWKIRLGLTWCVYSQDMLQTGCQANTLDIVNSLLNTVRSGSISSVLKLLIIQSKDEYSVDTTCPYAFLQL